MTIKEIAIRANVSIGTVDRVVHNRGEVAEKTRERVLQIIKEVNYKPNIFARNLVLNKTFHFAVLTPIHQSQDYWALPLRGLQRALDEFKKMGVQLHHYVYEGSEESFQTEADKLLAEKPDGVLMAPVFLELSKSFVQTCEEQAIPCVVFDTALQETKKLSFIGQDPFRSGRLAAKLLHYNSSGPQKIGIVSIAQNLQEQGVITNRRTEGFKAYFEAIKGEGQYQFVDLRFENQGEGLKESIGEKLKESGPLDALFIPNSKAYIICECLKDLSIINWPRIVGYDLVPQNVNLLLNDQIDFLINQRPEDQAYLGIDCLYKHLILNQEVAPEISMPIEIITKENYVK